MCARETRSAVVVEQLRRIRSFVRREGRLTVAQNLALENLSSSYIIDSKSIIVWDEIFGRNSRRVVEIGFGMGQSLAQMAAADRDSDFIGVEVHRPGVGCLLAKIQEMGLGNVRVITTDAVEVFSMAISPASIDCVQIFFPDPWPKRRHHKRRLIQLDFVEVLRKSLTEYGLLHIATDWADYARHVQDVMSNAPGWKVASEDVTSARINARARTKFENRGLRLGHKITDLVYERCD